MRDAMHENVEDRGRTTTRRTPDGPMCGNVMPFTMSREEETIGMEMAQSHLGQLVSECAAPNPGAMNDSWTRVKSGKKSDGVILWEKHCSREVMEDNWSSTSTINLQVNGPVTYSVRSSTTVSAPVEMVLKSLDASVATAHRFFTRIIYGNLVADAAILYHNSRPSPDFLASNDNDSFETLAVRWFVCRSCNPTVSDCDFCLQEYTKQHSIDKVSINGDYFINNKCEDTHDDDAVRGGYHQGLHPIGEKPVAYKLFQSIETRYCPESLASVRCKVPLGGVLLYPTGKSDKTDVVFFMTIAQGDPNTCFGNSALNNPMLTQCSNRQFRALQSVVRQMARQIGRLDDAVESYKLSLHLESLHSLQWVHNTERNECVVCCRRFHQLTRRRHHCRLCGEIICRECSVHKNVNFSTCGPTTLRICTSCNKVKRSKTSQAFASSEISRRRRATVNANQSIDYLKLETLEAPEQQQIKALSGNAKHFILKKREHKLDERQPVTAMEDRKILRQAAKPAIGRKYFSKKWGDKPSVVTPAPGTAKLASSPDGLPRFSSGTLSDLTQQPHSIPSHYSQRMNADLQSNDGIGEDELKSYADSCNSSLKLARSSSSCHQRAVYDENRSVLRKSISGNQQSWSQVTTNNQNQHDTPLIYRSFESLKMYEDIFFKLCENSASVRSSKFVALTLFTKSDTIQKNETEKGKSTVQYLKVRGRSTLLNTAANLRCCEPVLQLNKPIITRNTWALDDKQAVHPSKYDFRQLPIVFGPHQARFYAGVPLTDLKKGYRYGAIAIFDTSFHSGKDDDLPMKKTLQALQVCAREAVMAVDERRKDHELQTFLQAPLIQLRQSEPAIHLSMDIPQLNIDCQDLQSLDGDDDKNDVNETQGYFEYEFRNAKFKSGPEVSTMGRSSVGKNRVDLFRNKMQELVWQAQNTQAQMIENTLVMERHGVSTI